MRRGLAAAILAAGLSGASPAAAEVSGFGGPVLSISKIAGDGAILFGGRGGALFDGQFILGGAGFGLANTGIEARSADSDPLSPPVGGFDPGHVTLGYGGAWVGWIRPSEGRVRLSVHALLGAGSVGQDGGTVERSDGFFVAEPAVEASVRMSDSVRLGIGVSWRFVSGVELPALRNSDVDGPSLLVGVSFGGF